MIVLFIIGMRVLLGKSPGIAPPAAILLLVGGAFVMSFILFPFPRLTMGHPPPVCPIVLADSMELFSWVGLLAGLIGSIMLSRTTRYRYRPVQDA